MAEKQIVKGQIGNALESLAPDHILGVAKDIFDEKRQEYQQDINEGVGAYVDGGEFAKVYLDEEGKILFGIQSNGNIFFGAGVPQQVVDYINAKIEELGLNQVEDIINFLGDLVSSGKNLAQLLDDNLDYRNVIKHDVTGTTITVIEARSGWEQVARDTNADLYDELDRYQIGEVCNVSIDIEHSYKSLAQQRGNYPAQEVQKIITPNQLTLEEALAIIPIETKEGFKVGQIICFNNHEDSVERWELQVDGTWERLMPYIISTEEFVEVVLDEEDKIVEGTKKDGTKIFGGDVETEGKVKVKEDLNVEKDFQLKGNFKSPSHDITVLNNNSKFVEVHIDEENKILWGVTSDGDFIFGAKVPSQIRVAIQAAVTAMNEALGLETQRAQAAEQLNAQNIEALVTRLDTLGIAIDTENNILTIGGKRYVLIEDADIEDYTIYLLSVTQEENEEYRYVILDREDKILYSEDLEGVIFKADISDEEIEDVVDYFIENPPYPSDFDYQQYLEEVSEIDNEEFTAIYVDNANKILYGVPVNVEKPIIHPDITHNTTDNPSVSGADLDYAIEYMEYYNRPQKDLIVETEE